MRSAEGASAVELCSSTADALEERRRESVRAQRRSEASVLQGLLDPFERMVALEAADDRREPAAFRLAQSQRYRRREAVLLYR
jgi:hypothetical protein